jgi:heterodisulfide reductase subunit A-like polyferredoxin
MTTRSTEGTGAGGVSSGGTAAGGAAAAKAAPVKAASAKAAAVKSVAAKSAEKPRAAKKSKTSHLTPCNKCGGEIFRSSFRNFGEVVLSPILLPFRCSRCGWRQFRSSFSRVRDKSNYRRSTTDQ